MSGYNHTCEGHTWNKDHMDPWLERIFVEMFDFVILIIFVAASALTYLLVLGCESLMGKRS